MLGYITGSLSILGSGFIMFCVLYFKKWNNFHFRLVFMLSLSDLLYSFAGYFGNAGRVDGPESGLCKFQGIWNQLWGTFAYCWVMAIAYTLFSTIVLATYDAQPDETPEAQLAREHILFCKYFGVISIYSLICTALPAIGTTYGDAGAWCWIDNSTMGQVWRYTVFYVPVWLCMLGMTYMYYRIISQVRSLINEAHESNAGGGAHEERLHAVVRRLIAYPLIMFVAYFFATLNRIQNSAEPQNPSLFLYCAATFMMNISGLANAIVYGFNDSLQKDLRRCCGCEVDDDEEEEEEEEEDVEETKADGMVNVPLDADAQAREDIVAVGGDEGESARI